VYTKHSALYTVHSTLYTVHCTQYTVHCTQYTVHCTQYTVHCTQYTVHCTLYTKHCTLYTKHCGHRRGVYLLYSADIRTGPFGMRGFLTALYVNLFISRYAVTTVTSIASWKRTYCTFVSSVSPAFTLSYIVSSCQTHADWWIARGLSFFELNRYQQRKSISIASRNVCYIMGYQIFKVNSLIFIY